MTITSLLVAVQNDDDSTDDISRTIAQNQEEYHRKGTYTGIPLDTEVWF